MKTVVWNAISQIDAEFVKHYGDDPNVLSIFVVGSMADRKYEVRQNNDYDIRIVAKKVTPELLTDFEDMLKMLSAKLSTDKLCVGYSTLIAAANHSLSEDKCNILIHALIHAETDLHDFLPVTHQYTYGNLYHIVSGEDCLAQFKNVRYTLDDLRNCHEGLYYCIDMLEKREYRYLCWEIDGEKCNFVFRVEPLSGAVTDECCFYSVNKILGNLQNYARFNGYIVPDDRYRFAERFVGEMDVNTMMFLWGLVRKREDTIKMFSDDVVKKTVEVLRIFEKKMECFDEIFKK